MKINIHINLKHPQLKYIPVEYEFEFLEPQKELTLKFPVWSPGSYLVREFAANVEDFCVRNNRGKILDFEKTDKSSWKIFLAGTKKITLTYRVYANDLSVRGLYTDHCFAFANMPALLFYPDGQTSLSPHFKLSLPPRWKVSFARQLKNGSALFSDFDELYDTPFLAGADLEFHRFQVGKTQFELACQGLYDTSFAKIIPDLKKVIASQVSLFKSHPCGRYAFQVIFGPGLYGGLEHRASSTNMFDGLKLKDRREYQKFLTLLSHEHFHLWNVKRIRPLALGPFDLSRETYTRELWIAEGLTSYYDDHTAWRAGIYTREDYFAMLTENIHKYETGAARLHNSLSDSSFDAWIRFYRQNENSINRVTSYYLKGGLIMMLLDFDIIRRTRGKHTLDDVMRELFKLYKKSPQTGITREDFFNAVKKFSSNNCSRFIREHIDGVAKVDWENEFKAFGIKLKTGLPESPFYAGLLLKEAGGGLRIDKVAENSPAHSSPLQSGDEILAVNNIRFAKIEQLNYFLNHKKWRVLFARHGKIHECHFELARNEKFNKSLALKESLSAGEKRLLNRFLRR